MATLRRRLVTITRTLLLLAVVTPTLPFLVALGLVIDLVRRALYGRPMVAARLALFLEVYLVAEVVGLAALFFAWIAAGFGSARSRLIDMTYAVQSAWVRFLFKGLTVLFGLRFEIEGDELAKPGPILVLIRHVSIADVLLPTVFITIRHAIRLRFVLKRELLQDPCLDVAGNRIPNHFVARGSTESAAEIEAIRELTRDLGQHEGVLIYPEGTRFTEAKRRAAIERAAGVGGAALARVERFRRVLPPRHKGSLALLDGLTPADVIIFAHRGFEGLATVADVWRGGLVGLNVKARLWRFSRASIPATQKARADWLDERWAEVDAWVSAEETNEASAARAA